uniref:Uncharacterized protein n=1 Tax=Trichogramma kaykai TaxID=54128 RepID=A0ABD2W5Q0_9HYME
MHHHRYFLNKNGTVISTAAEDGITGIQSSENDTNTRRHAADPAPHTHTNRKAYFPWTSRSARACLTIAAIRFKYTRPGDERSDKREKRQPLPFRLANY